MATFSPSLDDVGISLRLIDPRGACVILTPVAYRALCSLVAAVAADMVWTYSPPGNGSLPDDDTALARIAGLSRAAWRRVRPDVALFFNAIDGRWWLNEDWVQIGTGSRKAISLGTKAVVLARAGRLCAYCGDTEGPFEFDHLYPVSRGGPDHANNIVMACVPCNRAKGGRTLQEWMGR